MKRLALATLVLAGGCMGSEMVSSNGDGDGDAGSGGYDAQVQRARVLVDQATEAIERSRSLLDLLGIMPDYTCGEPRGTYIEDAAAEVSVGVGCATVSTEARGPEEDALRLDFAADGCQVLGHDLAGAVTFTYAGGEQRMELSADFRELVVDGLGADAVAGYGTCGDETTYWVVASGPIPGATGRSFTVDGAVGSRAGVPIIGGSTILLDGTATLTGGAGTDTITFTDLEYERGDYLPKSGTVVIETADGHRIEATFSQRSPLYGEVVIRIDGGRAVTIPIV